MIGYGALQSDLARSKTSRLPCVFGTKLLINPIAPVMFQMAILQTFVAVSLISPSVYQLVISHPQLLVNAVIGEVKRCAQQMPIMAPPE